MHLSDLSWHSPPWLYVHVRLSVAVLTTTDGLYPRCDHLHVSWLRVIALTDTDEGYVWSGAARCMDLEPTALLVLRMMYPPACTLSISSRLDS